ncbi:unnamed protein product [Owenia fusiformis]|uniref:Uncharacterized protein n=1 Tax=Owenia fusiformis TaxID=6347 RepID=A0A8J1TGJ7_OWEFU|nr:unnamed protein product [Owenia fusiformis]
MRNFNAMLYAVLVLALAGEMSAMSYFRTDLDELERAIRIQGETQIDEDTQTDAEPKLSWRQKLLLMNAVNKWKASDTQGSSNENDPTRRTNAQQEQEDAQNGQDAEPKLSWRQKLLLMSAVNKWKASNTQGSSNENDLTRRTNVQEDAQNGQDAEPKLSWRQKVLLMNAMSKWKASDTQSSSNENNLTRRTNVQEDAQNGQDAEPKLSWRQKLLLMNAVNKWKASDTQGSSNENDLTRRTNVQEDAQNGQDAEPKLSWRQKLLLMNAVNKWKASDTQDGASNERSEQMERKLINLNR